MYCGPDRRAAVPEKPVPARQLAQSAAAGAVGATGIAAVAPDPPVAAAVAVAPLVIATVLLLCAWRVGGRSRPAHAALALALAGGVGPLTAWLSSGVAAPEATAPVTAVALAAGLLAAAPHARAARRAAAVRTDLRPGAALLGSSGLVLAAGAGAALLTGAGWSPWPAPDGLAAAPWPLLWPAALGATGGAALCGALASLRAALRAQQVRGLRAVAGQQRWAADLAEDRLRRHDARSALAAVRAASAVLTGEQPAVLPGATRRDLVVAVHEELHRVERLLADAAPPPTGTPGVVDLRSAADPVVTAWRARGLRVTGPQPGPPVLALGSEDAVRRVVANLLDNAQRHAPGAAVHLSVAVSTEPGGQSAVLTVTDDGPGVPAPLHTSLFTAGVTADPTSTGLGLASAQLLAEADGGSLRLLESDRGATFELRLPAGAATAPRPERTLAR
ncbi:Signal transduction histidine kinase [Quadrisphaera granulorum]|uniref:histidine kinase n=2 Tax=Quadrisphaera granulorum TaxID=317664 RepID=A0A316AGQ0_9ACTN|nr:signal transduction histidine kinase [Quadrisphaera granulorum]SZE98227.1 Signal transduction histidine kinase [Quadrisphaera granulorum]